jgi:hypothetical protein
MENKSGVAGKATDGDVIWHMRFECWINKATNTDSECVMCFAYPQQNLLRENASNFRYTRIACLVYTKLWLYWQ